MFATAALLTALLAVPVALAPVFATSDTVSGFWVITQAATQSNGQADDVVACGSLSFDNITPISDSQYSATLSFSLTYPDAGTFSTLGLVIPGINAASEPIGIQTSSPVPGALFFGFAGSDPVNLRGSLTSPSSVPHPSIDPSTVGCQSFLSPEFVGLVHLPGQGTEGMTIYGDPFSLG